MDTEAILAKVAAEHRVVLDKADPILIAVTLNELVLQEYLEHAERAAESSANRSSALAEQYQQAAKETAERLVSGAGQYIVDEVHRAGKEVQQSWQATLQSYAEQSQQAARDAGRAKHTAVWAAVCAGVLAALAVGIGIGTLLA